MDFIPKERFDLLSNGKIQEGDLLFCLRGSLGKFAVVEDLKEGAIASSLVIVRPTERLNRHFLAAYFGSRICANMIEKFENGAAQPNLSAKSLSLFEIPLPLLPEQTRIVAILDEAFEAISAAVAKAEKNLANARELFDNYLNAVFTQKGEGWVERKLGEIGKTQYGLSEKMNETGSGFKIFRMGEVQNGQLIDTGMMKYADITQGEFEKYNCIVVMFYLIVQIAMNWWVKPAYSIWMAITALRHT